MYTEVDVITPGVTPPGRSSVHPLRISILAAPAAAAASTDTGLSD